jgi:hypothetical protein
MIKSVKAWAARSENAADIAELKIVSTGSDVAMQIAAIDNFIQSGYDAVAFIAVNPQAFADARVAPDPAVPARRVDVVSMVTRRVHGHRRRHVGQLGLLQGTRPRPGQRKAGAG